MIVVDTNVLVRGFRSRNSASFVVLKGMITGDLSVAVSPALVFEYEDVLKRPEQLAHGLISEEEIDRILDAICARALLVAPWFRFRPFLNDPKDDVFVECALAAGAKTIVTDDKHFRHPSMTAFGLTAMKASELVAAGLDRTRR